MTMREFIRQNREEIDSGIRHVVPNISLNDSERRNWIMNDESLYRWARRSGVRI